MPSYLDRYLAGEHEQVWDELMALGAAVRDEPLYSDALAVARETMRRAKYNVETIVARLKENGYLFAYPDSIYVASGSNVQTLLDEREEKVGPIPISLRAWYEIISEVYLNGTHPNWRICADYSLCSGFAFFRSKFYEGRELEIERILYKKPFARIATFEMTTHFVQLYGEPVWRGKAGITIFEDEETTNGGFPGSSEIIAPDPSIDGTFSQPERNIAPTFVGYLRKCFEWGGFPGFEKISADLRPIDMLMQLVNGLLPI